MFDGELFSLVNLILCLMAIYMALHVIVSKPISSYSFKSGVRLVSLVICTVVFIVGAVFMTNELKFSRGGIVTNAEISGHQVLLKRTITQSPAIEYVVKYRFNDANNIAYFGEALVDKNTWEMAQANPYKKLKVVYVNDDPSLSRGVEESGFGQSLIMVLIGVAGLFSSLLFKTNQIYSYNKYQIKRMLAPYNGGEEENREREYKNIAEM